MHFSIFGLLLGLFNGMRTLAEKCDSRYCYNISGQVLMNNTKEILDICQSTSPPSQLLSIFDSDIQKSVVDFFVSDLTAFGRETSTYIVLALQKNAKGEWIWISTNTPASQSFQNWKEGNPIDSFPGSDCAFFTPQESSKWWNSLCSSKIVTVICMRVQSTQALTTIFSQTPRSTRDSAATTLRSTQPSFWTRITSTFTTTTTLAATTTTTSTTTTTTISTTTSTTSTSTTTTTTTPSPSMPATTSTTSTTTTTAAITTNKKLTQPSTTAASLLTINITSSSTSSSPIFPGPADTKNNPTDLPEDYIFKRNLGIGFGVSLGLVFIICLVSILITHFFKKNSRQNSKFSSVIDIDHMKQYKAQSIPPDVINDLENAVDRRSSDSGFDNEDSKTEPLERVESTDIHSDVESPESTDPLQSDFPVNPVSPRDSFTESGLEAPVESQFDWDYSSNTGASKKSIKKVSFDLEHVVEIPN